MNDRAFTLICAIGVFALFLAMFVRREGGLDPRAGVPRPITTERRGDGYNAAFTWLVAENVRAISLRDRFDKLADIRGLPASGNLLIVTLPATESFSTQEFQPLGRWIRAGNTLLVVAALSDTPDWSFRSAGAVPGDLNVLTGLEFETVESREQRLGKRQTPQPVTRDPRLLAAPEHATLVPNRPHAYFTNVSEVIALSDYSPQAWTVKVPYQGFVLALARQRETGEGALWMRPLGGGRIVVSGLGSIFTNRALGLGDNAQLLANIIAANVQGAVLFDDVHQGLGSTYDPERFYTDRRLYVTAGILIALWLVWVLGSTRLRLTTVRSAIPREAELVRAAGSFLARVLPGHAAARRLLEHFFQRVNRHAQRRESGPPWELLERQPRVAAADLEQLKVWYAEACAAKRVPLGRLYNLILRIDRSMA